MSYTDQEKMQEFERLKDFLESLDMAAEILPKGNVLDDIILLVSLPSIEEYPDDREATEADLHLAAGYLMDLDDTDQRLCKYLLFYSQIIVDLSSFERTEILENIDQKQCQILSCTDLLHGIFSAASRRSGQTQDHRVTCLLCQGKDPVAFRKKFFQSIGFLFFRKPELHSRWKA